LKIIDVVILTEVPSVLVGVTAMKEMETAVVVFLENSAIIIQVKDYEYPFKR
jgi:hypothetical protein